MSIRPVQTALMVGAVASVGVLALTQTHKKPAPKKPAPHASGKTVTTKSGLKYIDVKVGTGAHPKQGDSVTVQYTGWLTNGTKFDSSRDPGKSPFTFVIGEHQVIQGWDEGVMSMKVGGRRTLIIPPALGYGADGAGGGVIPGNATLKFDVELLKVG